MKKAVSVTLTIETRVIIDENDDDVRAIELAIPRIIRNMDSDMYENFKVEKDMKYPFDPEDENDVNFNID